MISILLPIFNGENFLDDSVNSIKKQTHKNWELSIGINGHGLDSKIYKRISEKFKDEKKIKVFQYDVKSKPLTLNLLAKEGDSKFVALIDVDDVWEPTKLQNQIPFLKTFDVVGTSGRYMGKKRDKINVEVGKITYEQIFFHNCFINSSIVMKREDVEFDDVFLDDYNMWFKLITKNRKFYNVDQVLVNHRLHDKSFFNGTNNGSVSDLKAKWLKIFGEKNVMMDRFGTTIIMPLLFDTYTSADIKISLDSVLKQEWKGYECLIVISEDKIINMVRDIINKNYNEEEKKYLNIKKLKEKRITANLSDRIRKVRLRQYYDKCMKLGKYNLIAFIEPKDIWKPNKLFHQVMWIHGYDVHCVGGSFYNHPTKKGFQDKIVLPSRDPDASKFYRSCLLLKRNKFKKYPIMFGHKTFLFHRHMDCVEIHYP